MVSSHRQNNEQQTVSPAFGWQVRRVFEELAHHHQRHASSAEESMVGLLGGSGDPLGGPGDLGQNISHSTSKILNHYSIMGFGRRQWWQNRHGEPQGNPHPDEGHQWQHHTTQRVESAAQYPVADDSLPFWGGVIVLWGYEAYQYLDPVWQGQRIPRSQYPEMTVWEAEHWVVVDHLNQCCYPLSLDESWCQWVHTVWDRWQHQSPNPPPSTTPQSKPKAQVEGFQVSFTPAGFESAVNTLLGDIQAGEMYQGNMSMALTREVHLSPWAVFDELCQVNPSPFVAYLQWPGMVLVSNSPERLVSVDGQGHMETRPIAGTRGRGKTPAEDRNLGETLHNDPKERAEHCMLVDLLRNDLGRVALAGTVTVDELMVLERYSHVTHLVSNVVGQRHPEATSLDVLASLFPGGTITGCPKLRCIELLQNVEAVPRGLYTGSLGYIDGRTGAMDFNILIRTAAFYPSPSPRDSHQTLSLSAQLPYDAHIHAGAGIVADSVPAYEYGETLRKLSAWTHTLSRFTQEAQQPLLTIGVERNVPHG